MLRDHKRWRCRAVEEHLHLHLRQPYDRRHLGSHHGNRRRRHVVRRESRLGKVVRQIVVRFRGPVKTLGVSLCDNDPTDLSNIDETTHEALVTE